MVLRVGIMTPFNTSVIIWQILDYLWNYLFSNLHTHTQNIMALICQYTLIGIYNAFLFSNKTLLSKFLFLFRNFQGTF